MYWKSIKEFVFSSLITFVTVFLGAILPFLGGSNLEQGAFAAVAITALRLGVVAALGVIYAGFKKLSS